MKKIVLILLCVPLFLLGGLGYAFIAHKLVGDREPWFTGFLVGGLAATVALLSWCTGTPLLIGLEVFAGTGLIYLCMCLVFGKGSRVEMLVPAHIMAVLGLMACGVFMNGKKKALRTSAPAPSHYQTSTSSSSCAAGTAGAFAGLTKS
ncbi:hypothetical protein [Prosthecobacter sp.]|uniref:hypothetical protein n=1 Tax=Prosthecobacter sp. TaxID=1965333 RepID=UPI0037847EE2